LVNNSSACSLVLGKPMNAQIELVFTSTVSVQYKTV
jgi:hypothetical protein